MATQHTPIRESVTSGEEGYSLGIAGFISSFFVSIVGLVLSIIALKQSKAIGKKNPFALAGLILSIVGLVIGLLVVAASILGAGALINYCVNNPKSCDESSSNSSQTAPPSDDSGTDTPSDSDKTY